MSTLDLAVTVEVFDDARQFYLWFLTQFLLQDHLLISGSDYVRLDHQPQSVIARNCIPNQKVLTEMVGDGLTDIGALTGAYGNLAATTTDDCAIHRKLPPQPLSPVYFGNPDEGYTFLFRSELSCWFLQDFNREQKWEIIDAIYAGRRVLHVDRDGTPYKVPHALEMYRVGDCYDFVYEGEFIKLPGPEQLTSNGITSHFSLDGMTTFLRFDDGRPCFHTTMTYQT